MIAIGLLVVILLYQKLGIYVLLQIPHTVSITRLYLSNLIRAVPWIQDLNLRTLYLFQPFTNSPQLLLLIGILFIVVRD